MVAMVPRISTTMASTTNNTTVHATATNTAPSPELPSSTSRRAITSTTRLSSSVDDERIVSPRITTTPLTMMSPTNSNSMASSFKRQQRSQNQSKMMSAAVVAGVPKITTVGSSTSSSSAVSSSSKSYHSSATSNETSSTSSHHTIISSSRSPKSSKDEEEDEDEDNEEADASTTATTAIGTTTTSSSTSTGSCFCSSPSQRLTIAIVNSIAYRKVNEMKLHSRLSYGMAGPTGDDDNDETTTTSGHDDDDTTAPVVATAIGVGYKHYNYSDFEIEGTLGSGNFGQVLKVSKKEEEEMVIDLRGGLGRGSCSDERAISEEDSFDLDEILLQGDDKEDDIDLPMPQVSNEETAEKRDVNVNKKYYALKRLSDETLTMALSSKRKIQKLITATTDLLIEAYILSQLDHPNIVKLHGVAGKSFGTNKDVVKRVSMFDVLSKPIGAETPIPTPPTVSPTSSLYNGYFIVIDQLQPNMTLKEKFSIWKTKHDKLIKQHETQPWMFPTRSHLQEMLNRFLLQRLKDVVLPIVDAMEYIHSKKIIYRDLKPSNIGFDLSTTTNTKNQQVVKLFDFGLARERHLINKTKISGSLRYIAPECCIKKNKKKKKMNYSRRQGQDPQDHQEVGPVPSMNDDDTTSSSYSSIFLRRPSSLPSLQAQQQQQQKYPQVPYIAATKQQEGGRHHRRSSSVAEEDHDDDTSISMLSSTVNESFSTDNTATGSNSSSGGGSSLRLGQQLRRLNPTNGSNRRRSRSSVILADESSLDFSTTNHTISSRASMISPSSLQAAVIDEGPPGGATTTPQEDNESDGDGYYEYDLSADVYSFGVLLWEICTLDRAYDEYIMTSLSPTRTFHDMVHIQQNRPSLTKDDVFVASNTTLRYIIHKSWHPNPSKRLTFSQIKNMLKKKITLLMTTDEPKPLNKKIKSKRLSPSSSTNLGELSVPVVTTGTKRRSSIVSKNKRIKKTDKKKTSRRSSSVPPPDVTSTSATSRRRKRSSSVAPNTTFGSSSGKRRSSASVSSVASYSPTFAGGGADVKKAKKRISGTDKTTTTTTKKSLQKVASSPTILDSKKIEEDKGHHRHGAFIGDNLLQRLFLSPGGGGGNTSSKGKVNRGALKAAMDAKATINSRKGRRTLAQMKRKYIKQ